LDKICLVAAVHIVAAHANGVVGIKNDLEAGSPPSWYAVESGRNAGVVKTDEDKKSH
jgi:hypothetical protein